MTKTVRTDSLLASNFFQPVKKSILCWIGAKLPTSKTTELEADLSSISFCSFSVDNCRTFGNRALTAFIQSHIDTLPLPASAIFSCVQVTKPPVITEESWPRSKSFEFDFILDFCLCPGLGAVFH